MTFFNPTYLWTLLGLLVPIAIHLWSKKEGKTIKVGSIELLRESESKQTSNLKPNELWLLLLRLCIIALVTIILAEPQLSIKTENKAITYLIEPSLIVNNKASSILNTIDENHVVRLLSKGFPEAESVNLELFNSYTPNYWQLAKEMQSIASDCIIVYTKASVLGFKGTRPLLNKNIEWITVNTEEIIEEKPIMARRIDTNIELLSMSSQDEFTSFEKSIINEKDFKQKDLEVLNQQPLKILMYYENAFLDDSKYIEASLNAISKHINRSFNINKTQENQNIELSDYDLIIWLSENNISLDHSSKLIEFKSDELSNVLIEKSLKPNNFYLTAHLNSENSVEQHLPEQLLKILILNKNLSNTIEEHDKRTLSKAEFIPSLAGETTTINAANYLSISKWLWFFLGIGLICERLLASYRKQ